MDQDERFLPLFLDALRSSPATAVFALIGTAVPLSVGFLSWLLGAPALIVLVVTAVSAPIVGYGAYVYARMVWKGEIGNRRRLEKELDTCRAQRASLSIVSAQEHPLWWAEQNWCRIGVHNGGKVAAQHVEARLESMAPDPLNFNVLPSLLGRKGGNTENCHINPGKTEFFDVFQWDRAAGCLLLMTVEWTGQPFALSQCPDHQCRLHVQVTASNADHGDYMFTLRHLPDKQPEFHLLSPAGPG